MATLVMAADPPDTAFERIVLAHQRRVLGLAWRLLGNTEDARDASQEVFTRAFRHFGRFDSTRDVVPWLYRITFNVCRDMGRRRRPCEPVPDDLVSPDAGPLAALEQDERRRLVLAALRRLPERERAALVLRDLEGLPTAEVARILGSSEPTVRSQISSARLKIRAYLRRTS